MTQTNLGVFRGGTDMRSDMRTDAYKRGEHVRKTEREESHGGRKKTRHHRKTRGGKRRADGGRRKSYRKKRGQ